jgi:hypothetical protein
LRAAEKGFRELRDAVEVDGGDMSAPRAGENSDDAALKTPSLEISVRLPIARRPYGVDTANWDEVARTFHVAFAGGRISGYSEKGYQSRVAICRSQKPPANRPLAQIAIKKRQSIADSFLARGRPARP